MYSTAEAEALTKMEHKDWRKKEDQLKTSHVIANLAGCQSLLEIGCGWGQLLKKLRGKVAHLAGLDESHERLDELKRECPDIEIYHTRADKIDIPDESFDIILTSQMLHEVKLFGRPGELEATLNEIKRILKKGGRYFLIDHYDPGENQVEVTMNADMLKLLREFRDKYKYRPVHFQELASGKVAISKRDIQDFATKTWAMGTSMEDMEMNETHAPFNREELKKLVVGLGFAWEKWETFHPMSIDLHRQGIKITKGKPWNRKLFMIVRR